MSTTATQRRAQPQEQRLPGIVIYYGPEIAVRFLEPRPLNCDTDPRWRWPDVPQPLSFWQRFRYERALSRRIRAWRRETRG